MTGFASARFIRTTDVHARGAPVIGDQRNRPAPARASLLAVTVSCRAYARTKHKLFARRSCSTVEHAAARSAGDATTLAKQRALERATLVRWRENRNVIPRGACSASDVAIEIRTAAAS